MSIWSSVTPLSIKYCSASSSVSVLIGAPSSGVPRKIASQPPGYVSVTSVSGTALRMNALRMNALRMNERSTSALRMNALRMNALRMNALRMNALRMNAFRMNDVSVVDPEAPRSALGGMSPMRTLDAPAGMVSVFVLNDRSSPSGVTSSAPRSHLPPAGCGRGLLRWSTGVAHGARVGVDRRAPGLQPEGLGGATIVGERPELRVGSEDGAACGVATRRRPHQVRARERRRAEAVGTGRRRVAGEDAAGHGDGAGLAVEPASLGARRRVRADGRRAHRRRAVHPQAAAVHTGVAGDRAVLDDQGRVGGDAATRARGPVVGDGALPNGRRCVGVDRAALMRRNVAAERALHDRQAAARHQNAAAVAGDAVVAEDAIRLGLAVADHQSVERHAGRRQCGRHGPWRYRRSSSRSVPVVSRHPRSSSAC